MSLLHRKQKPRFLRCLGCIDRRIFGATLTRIGVETEVDLVQVPAVFPFIDRVDWLASTRCLGVSHRRAPLEIYSRTSGVLAETTPMKLRTIAKRYRKMD